MKIVHNIDTERETSRLAAVPVAKPSDDPGVMECPNALRAGTSRAPHIANFVALVVVTRGGHMKTFIVITGLVILIMILTPCSAAAAEQSAQRERMSQGGSETNATSYDSSRKHLESARENLRQAKNDAAQGIQQQLSKAREQLGTLADRLEDAARTAGSKTASAARDLQEGISLRTRRMEARALLLRSRAESALAVHAASQNDFARAEQHLSDATEYLRRARAALYDDHAYDDQLDDMAVKLRQANDAIKGHAREARIKINQILMDADRIVGSLEKQETQAASLQGK